MIKTLNLLVIISALLLSVNAAAMEKQPKFQTKLGWLAYKCWVPTGAIYWVGSNIFGLEDPAESEGLKGSESQECLEDFTIVDFSLIQPLKPEQRQKYVETFYSAEGARPFDNVTYEQILKDITRTHTARTAFFGNQKMAQSLTRVLYVWSKEYQEQGYSQGYNDIAAHLFVRLFDAFYKFRPIEEDKNPDIAETEGHWVFQAYDWIPGDEYVIENMSDRDLTSLEAHVYTCLDRILGSFLRATKAGKDSEHLMRMTSTVIEILKEVDPELSEHLTFILDLCHADLTPVVVAWNTYFFAREFPSSALSVLWDAYLLDEGDGGFALLHPYVCCALIEALRVEVLKLPRKVRSFEKLLALLKDPPVGHWPLDRFESLIKRAQNMRRHHPEFVAKFADQLKAQIHHHEEEKSTVATCSDSFIAFALASLATIQSNDEHQRFVAESLRRFPEIDVNTIHRFSQAVRKDLRDGRTVSFEAAKHIFRKIAAFY